MPISPSTLYFRELLYRLWGPEGVELGLRQTHLNVLLAILAAAFVGCFHSGPLSPPTEDDSYSLIQGWTSWKLVSAF